MLMEDMADNQIKVLKHLCDRIALEQPEAIGMAFIELDCGCINVCGVSANGEPAGTLRTIPGLFIDQNQKQPVCIQCYRDKTLDLSRVVRKGLLWPGSDLEKPIKELRHTIGQTVFGPDYMEASE